MKTLFIAGIAIIISIKANAQKVQKFTLKDLPTKNINELLTRSSVFGEKGNIGYFTYKKGAVVPTHQHRNEQYSLIINGSVEVKIYDTIYIVKAGDGIIIPPNVPHSFTSLEDNTIDIDFFSPLRADWLNETDNYYNKESQETQSTKWNGKKVQSEVFTTVEQSVGNIAFTYQGDLVYSHHPFFNPKFRVVKYDAKTKTTMPFPNEEWNIPRETDDHYLSNVLGIRNDENGIVWMLDMGQRNAVTPKIVGWNTITDKLEHIYYLPETSVVPTSQPNDMVVDTKHNVFVIADEGIGNGGNGSTAALIVVDMTTGKTRRLLQGTRSTLPENLPTIINGKSLAVNGKNLLVGCDGITADKNFEWLYFAPLNGSKLYRVKMDDLLNENLTEAELDKQIETYSDKPNNGGLSIDNDGNIYLTAMESNSVAVILAKDKTIHNIVTDKRLLWADGVSYNAVDGYMYVSAAQVHLGSVFNNRKNLAKPPFYIFRFKPFVKGVPYR